MPPERYTPQQVAELQNADMPAGKVQFMFCLICGALTWVKFAGNDNGLGDPQLHAKYHRDREELFD